MIKNENIRMFCSSKKVIKNRFEQCQKHSFLALLNFFKRIRIPYPYVFIMGSKGGELHKIRVRCYEIANNKSQF